MDIIGLYCLKEIVALKLSIWFLFNDDHLLLRNLQTLLIKHVLSLIHFVLPSLLLCLLDDSIVILDNQLNQELAQNPQHLQLLDLFPTDKLIEHLGHIPAQFNSLLKLRRINFLSRLGHMLRQLFKRAFINLKHATLPPQQLNDHLLFKRWQDHTQLNLPDELLQVVGVDDFLLVQVEVGREHQVGVAELLVLQENGGQLQLGRHVEHS